MKFFALAFLLAIINPASAQSKRAELIQQLEKSPNDQVVLYNLGMNYYLAGEYPNATKHWEQLITLAPKDWEVREKLIQSYHAVGNLGKAESEMVKLRQAWASKVAKKYVKQGFFIREQIVLPESRIYVLEYFELKGDRGLIWKFKPRENKELSNRHYSLGSYQATTESARNRGNIKPTERLYHLDGYWNDGKHVTYSMTSKKPTYASVRADVLEAILGRKEELSSSSPQ